MHTTKQMRLLKVFGYPFSTICIRCGDKVWGGDNMELYADLDGEAYKAYYCKDCLTPEELTQATKNEIF